ncbi:MAG: hypothetical protein U1F68_18685 [Gammaproteobacteria bacterium]
MTEFPITSHPRSFRCHAVPKASSAAPACAIRWCSAAIRRRSFQLRRSRPAATLRSYPAIALVNPIAADLAVTAHELVASLVKALLHNQKRQQERVRLF